MSLFINNGKYPTLYKTKANLKASNQSSFRLNYLSELLDEQQRINKSLSRSFDELQLLQQQHQFKQSTRWQDVDNQLNALKEQNVDRENVTKHTQAQLTEIDQSTQAVLQKLESYQQINLQMMEMLSLQKQMADQINHQEKHHDHVLDRLESQEALMQKALRQLDNIRATIFERASHLSDKMEDGYHVTAAYFYKLVSGSKQPLNFFMMKDRKEEQDKK
ncbi:hypothetical protein [Radiobacillus sp. PE A8.2]|uniref:hypothetical protein n=1 Tax=Radiobacillus sp. PE A8.2 TaxID=3380349 RepID=UPI00388E163A